MYDDNAVYGQICNSSGVKTPQAICNMGWTPAQLDEFCLANQLLWHPNQSGGAHICGPCGRDCSCHDGRGHELRPLDSDGLGCFSPRMGYKGRKV